ncbi:MAG: DNA polymerase III subunit beta [Planctomycetaceae bacterium]|nr:DNA polymerase III subunit beta [Planctomycetaceae bacterium]|tara:strand:+ start:502 stop:2232 length:1731 start_codon:yes stop_codon:yes gene_type:complete
MENGKISAQITKLADLLEFQGANSFKIRAYRRGARVIKDSTDSFATLVTNDPSQLLEIDGIGKGVAEKIRQLLQTGEIAEINEILETVPSTVLDILRIPGLGPKKAAALYQELNIQTLDQLQAACEANEVQQLKGFAAKTEESILDGITIAAAANQRIYWSDADDLVQSLRTHLQTCQAVRQLEFAGSYRRGRETVGDLDILVDSADADTVMAHFCDYPDLQQVIVQGDTKMSIRVGNSFQVDLRVVETDAFGAALQYFTGSKDHNVELRGRAKQLGLKINEYGVFRINGDNETYLAGATEADVYTTLNLPCFAPEIRESRNEFAWAEDNSIPELITIDQIQGDLHMHTTATDGKASIEEMAAAAKGRGLKYIAITDHSQRVSVANGLDAERLLQQWKEIDRINARQSDDFIILKGIECDILENGSMDLPDQVLAQADWVIASIHFGQKQPGQQITDRITGALENPHIDIIAHPTGRLINRREAYAVDMEAVFQAAKENSKLLELNANPVRLDLHDIHCAMARERGIPIVINSDAHKITGLDVMKYGIKQARRGGLTADHIANTKSWAGIQSLLSS